MSNQSRLMLSSSSSSQITNNSSTTPQIGSSRVRRPHPQNQRNRRPQRGMGVAKLEKLRMEKMLEEQNILSASSASLVPFSNNSTIHSPLQNSQSSHNFLRSPSPLRNLVPNFSRRSNFPSEYLQYFGSNNNSFHPQHFQSSLNDNRTAPPVLQQTQTSRRNIPNSPSLQTPSNNPSHSVIDPARVLAGMVAPNRAQMDPFGYAGVETVVQTSSSPFSEAYTLFVKKQRTSQKNAGLNVVENRNNTNDSLRSGAGSYGGQYANNNLGGSVMTHAGLIAAQQDGVQNVNAYNRKEIVYGYKIIPGEGAKGIGLLKGATLTWNEWTSFHSVADPPLVSSTTPNSSITSFHSEETNSGADTVDLTLKLSF